MKESRRITPLRTILRNCLNHIENLEVNPSSCYNYDKEFQDLKQFSETLKVQKEFSCTEGEKEVNKKKNRYKDILPFNLSRVVLNEYAGVPGSDYINANFIKGASGSPAYIASQGPLPNTVNDFWRMVVECEVQVIVMACNAQESGKHKCENYWVEKEGEEKRFGMVQICLVKASTVCPDFLVRTMRLKYTNDKDITEERTVCQFHYSAWPDHGVPPLVRPLLDMVRLVRDTQASETLPVLVHCSAGCGRTGTICAIDFVWGLLRAGKLTEEFSLFNLVRDMRKQRVAMVQTKEQYILVHQAVRELFKEQLKVIESHPYENIDFNGVPLIKDLEEPFYETICLQKEENCDEKQDTSEAKEKKEDTDIKMGKMETAPPLPKKKRPNVVFSKQEKEAENLTEKNRLSFGEKEKTDAGVTSILGKPKIVRLRALFEKSQIAKERSALKDRGSHTVSRSHSLGAIRKPLTTELFESQFPKSITQSSPYQSSPPEPVKLKQSKSFSKSVPLITRSKSLKSFSKSFNITVSPSAPLDKKVIKSYPSKSQCINISTSEENDSSLRSPPSANIFTTAPSNILENGRLVKDNSGKRRSLESLMEDIPSTITWPITAMDVGWTNENLNWPSQISCKETSISKTADLLRQQLQSLDLRTEVAINKIASGIGTRERRNSFRQAVNKSELELKSSFNDVLPKNYFTTKNSGKEKNLTDISFSLEKKNSNKFFEPNASPSMEQQKIKVASCNLEENSYKTQDQTIPLKCSVNSLAKNWYPKKESAASVQNDKTVASHNKVDSRTQKIFPNPQTSSTCDEFDLILVPKNLFLKKLNSEILFERERNQKNYTKPNDQHFSPNSDASSKASSQLIDQSYSKIHEPKANIRSGGYISREMDETDGFKTRLIKESKLGNMDAVNSRWIDPNFQNHQAYQKNFKASRTGQHQDNEPRSHSLVFNSCLYKTEPPRKEIPLHTASGETSSSLKKKELKLQNARNKNIALTFSTKNNMSHLAYTKVPISPYHEKEPSSSSNYRRDLVNPEGFNAIHTEHENFGKKLQKCTKTVSAEQNQKGSFDWESHPTPSKLSGEEILSNQHCTKLEPLKFSIPYEADATSMPSSRLYKKFEATEKMVQVHSSDKSKNQNSESVNGGICQPKKTEETLKSAGEFGNYGLFATQKMRPNVIKYSKDDFLLEEPTAPPRVKRHASVTILRSSLSTFNNAGNVPIRVASESKPKEDRKKNIKADKGSFDVDLDAVAASMQQGESSVLKNSIWPGKGYSNGSSTSFYKKKQHYF